MNKSNLKPRCVEIWYEKWNNFLVLWLAILQMIQIHMENHSCCHLLAQIPPDPCEDFGTLDIVQEDREVLSSRPDGDDAEEPKNPCSLVFKHPRNHSLDMIRWFTLIWDHRICGCHMNDGISSRLMFLYIKSPFGHCLLQREMLRNHGFIKVYL